jgi:bacterioferritin
MRVRASAVLGRSTGDGLEAVGRIVHRAVGVGLNENDNASRYEHHHRTLGYPLTSASIAQCRHSNNKEPEMQGDAKVLEYLNLQLKHELTAINQYFLHYRMLKNWGYARLAKHEYEESIEEMKHADDVIERILFLDGIPNMQRLGPVKVGEEPVEQHQLDLELELDARKRLNDGIALCREKGDNGTRELLEKILIDEEEAIDWLESQLHLVKEVGRERYLAEQIHG